MPRRSAAAIAATPVIDLATETHILRYHTATETNGARNADAPPVEQQQPRIGVREVVAEIQTDIWTALQQGVI